jgi:hypothetical protein
MNVFRLLRKSKSPIDKTVQYSTVQNQLFVVHSVPGSPSEATYLAISDNLQLMAVGFESGAVYLYRSQSLFKFCLLFRYLVKGSQNGKSTKVPELGWKFKIFLCKCNRCGLFATSIIL